MAKITKKFVEHDKVLDLTSFLGSSIAATPKVKNRIDKGGVELEGAWPKLPNGVQLEHDGSVHPHKTALDREKFPYVGEIVSKPIAPAGIGIWMRKNYPGLINETCGLHVHMSFPDINYYSSLMAEEYQETIIHYLTLWAKEEKLEKTHPIWNRLEGKSEYCLKKHWPDKQAQSKRKIYDRRTEGNRYTIVNYCYQQHETIEVRVLPMFGDAEQAIRAVKAIFNITNASIVALTKKSAKLIDEIYLSPKDKKELEATLSF